MMRRAAALLAAWGLAAAQVDHEIHDSRSPGYNGRPPLPAPEGMVLNIDTDVVATDGVAGHTTWRISAATGGEMQNMYAIFADSNHTVVLPPAFQVPAPFGADVGGTNPQLWSFKPETQYDSWLTVSADDGVAHASGALTTMGIDLSAWSASAGLSISSGSIFWLVADKAPEEFPVLLGQLTVPSGQAFRGLLNARGKSRNLIGVDPPPKVADWEIKCVVFGTDPSDVGLRTDANGHCSAETLQAAPPPPPAPATGTESCTKAVLDARLDDVQDRCCEEKMGDGGEESVCAGGLPPFCDARCAEAFLPFWESCATLLAANSGSDDEYSELAAKCKAAAAAGHR